MIGDYNGLIPLVDDLEVLGNHSHLWMLLASGLVGNRHLGTYGVADEYRSNEAQVVIAVREGNRVDERSGEADADAKGEGAMRNPLTELRLFCELGIHVMREEVSCLPRMDDDVGFCDGAPARFSGASDLVIFEIACLFFHESAPFDACV